MKQKTISTLLAISITTAIVSLGALSVSVYLFLHRTDQIQTAVRDSAYGACKLFQVVILGSSKETHRVKQGNAFLRRYHLDDCHKHARSVTSFTSTLYPPFVIIEK